MRHSDISGLVAQEGRVLVLQAVRTVLQRLRGEIRTAHLDSTGIDLVIAGLPGAVDTELRRSTAFSLEPVINATGVILHTNLGRAPLARSAVEHIREIAEGYSTLELDLQSGVRGRRDVHVDRLFRTLLATEVTGQGAGWGSATI